MKNISIQSIEKLFYTGPVYNLELDSNSDQDDLFWIEQETGIVTHNCLPKDLKCIEHMCRTNNLNVDFFKNILDENTKYKVTVFNGMRES